MGVQMRLNGDSSVISPFKHSLAQIFRFQIAAFLFIKPRL